MKFTIAALLDFFVTAFEHNSKLAKNEPSWGSVDKGKLPDAAFADRKDRKYPHHWVTGGKVGDEGKFTSGTMYLHKGGLHAALSAAGGARSGKKASSGVVAHLRRHAAAIGMGKDKTAAALEITVAELEVLDAELVKDGLMSEADFLPVPAAELSAYLEAPCEDCK